MESTARLLVELPDEQWRILVIEESNPTDQPKQPGALDELQRLYESATREATASALCAVTGWARLVLASFGAAPLVIGAVGVGRIGAWGGGTAAFATLVGCDPMPNAGPRARWSKMEKKEIAHA